MALTVADYQKHNFFRIPDWRWQRVLALVERFPTPGRCTRFDDTSVRQARTFIYRYRGEADDHRRQMLFAEFPGLFYAYQFRERMLDSPEAPLCLEARLLAGETDEQIAEATGTLPDAVAWYEKLFFNVRDRLKHRDWITAQVLLPAFRRHYTLDTAPPMGDASPFRDPTIARPYLDGTLKFFAYFGGRYIADVMISGFQSGKPLVSPDDYSRWMDGHWASTLRRRSTQAATSFPITKYNITELFAVHAKIVELDRAEDAEGQQQNSTERHVQALMDAIPWAVGASGEAHYRTTRIGAYDEGASELRDTELLRLGNGDDVKPEFIERLPEPNPKKVASFANPDTDLE